MTTTNISNSKKMMRKQIRESLSSLSQLKLVEQSTKVFDQVFSLPQYQNAKSVGLFLSMPKGEIMTEEACRRVIKDGKSLYIPRVGLDFEKYDMEMVRVPKEEIKDDHKLFYESWPKNKWGIPEAPVSDKFVVASPGDIDFLLVPGLGFDRKGGRLGQGKGYYDRFIEKMRSNSHTSSPLLVAVGLKPSLVEEGIPMAEYDIYMNIVIIPDEVIHIIQ